MNQKFKLKYDELREGNPAKQPDENAIVNSETENQNYDRPGNIRNLSFAWPNGTMEFFNYAYLVSCKINVGEEENRITIKFTSDTVTLKGYNLGELFLGLKNQTPSVITQLDARYVSAQDHKNIIVTEISIEMNK